MKFWIVTPSYNQLEWLKLCVASVRDQVSDGVKNYDLGVKLEGNSGADLKHKTEHIKHRHEPITVHHHVQDACSTDGTREFLAEHLANSQQLEARAPNAQCPEPSAETSSPNAQCPVPNAYSFSFSSEKDEGMYDAINRGWKMAPDDMDVIAHLNCDEQYLPGALQTIADFFKAHAAADVVLADMIVVDKHGDYICHRRSVQPYAFTSRFCCGGFTATTFQRVSVTADKGVYFDSSWKNFGDKVWYNALHRAGCRFSVCNQLVAVFTDTGANLNWTDEGLKERRLYEERFLGGNRLGTTVIARINGLRRLLKEKMLKPPESYTLYKTGYAGRIHAAITNPRGLWHKKWKK